MPKSKRDKKVSLTQTKKKGLELKQTLISEIRKCVDTYPRIFVFSMDNMRNSKLKDVRSAWRHSRFFFGKNKVMSVALGKDSGSEYRDGLNDVSKALKGQRGVLFSAKTADDTAAWFEKFCEKDFSRSGNRAIQTVVLAEGAFPQFSHTMEPQLRKLGVPTVLRRGVINLREEYRVCRRGEALSPEQAQILKLFGHEMAEIRVTLEGVWSEEEGYKDLDKREEDEAFAKKIKVKAVKIDGDDVFEYEPMESSDEEEVNQSDFDMEDD